MHRALLRLLPLPLAAASILAACSGDDAISPAPSGSATSSSSATASSTGSSTGAGGMGGGGTGGSGGGGTGGAAFVPAPHAPFPKLNPHSGTILKHPKLVTVTFPGYAHKDEVEAFGGYLVTSPWLAATGTEYGVGPGTNVSFVLPDTAPMATDDKGLVDLIGQRIADKTLPDGDVNDTLYMLYVPGSTTVTDDGTLCTEFVGYHGDAMVNGKHIAYAIIGDCDGPITDTTSTAAHELIEAATDTYDGYYMDPPLDDPWYFMGGSENADLCQYLPDFYQDDYAMQRSWSDVAAAAGASPCVPIPQGEIYYNVTAEPAKLPVVAAGDTVTFTLTGWSTAPLDDWGLKIDDTTPYDFDATWELDKHSINNGKQVKLTLTVPPGTPSGLVGGVLVDSGSGYGRFWPVAVVVK